MLKQSNSDSTIRGNIIRSSSLNSIVVNWHEITKGAFSQIQNKKDVFKFMPQWTFQIKPK